jgi:hypothetical protein
MSSTSRLGNGLHGHKHTASAIWHITQRDHTGLASVVEGKIGARVSRPANFGHGLSPGSRDGGRWLIAQAGLENPRPYKEAAKPINLPFDGGG